MTMPEHTDEEKELWDEIAKALYAFEPSYDQPVDLDGRATGPAGALSWQQCVEADDGYANLLYEKANAALAAMRRLRSSLDTGEGVTDSAMLDWLDEQIVNVIELDDGRLIDTRGLGVRNALRAALSKGETDRG